MKSVIHWISVEDKIPDLDKVVLTVNKYGFVECGQYSSVHGHVFEHDLLKQKISQFLQDWHKHADGFTVQDVYIEEDCADLMADGIIKLFTPRPESPETHKDSD